MRFRYSVVNVRLEIGVQSLKMSSRPSSYHLFSSLWIEFEIRYKNPSKVSVENCFTCNTEEQYEKKPLHDSSLLPLFRRFSIIFFGWIWSLNHHLFMFFFGLSRICQRIAGSLSIEKNEIVVCRSRDNSLSVNMS
jgi:hypothetical protein